VSCSGEGALGRHVAPLWRRLAMEGIWCVWAALRM
jgi:hypothetical protein